MSYRNPKIIDDKSGLIVPQAIAQGAAALAKGITDYGIEEKKRLAKIEVKNKKDQASLIAIGNLHAKNSAVFNAGLKDMSESMRSTLITRNERLLNRIDEIKRSQIVDGNTSVELSKELGILQQGLLEGNSLSEDIIGTSGILTELVSNAQKLGDTVFYKEDEEGSLRSETIIKAAGGAEGFKASMIEKEGQLYASFYNKEANKTYDIPAAEFKSLAEDLLLERSGNASVQQIETINKELREKDGSIKQGLINTTEKMSPEVRGPYIVYGNIQTLDTKQISAIRENSIDKTMALIESSNQSTQLQNTYLNDLKIDPAEYRNKSAEEQREMVADKAGQLFEDSTGIKIKKTGNEADPVVYYKEVLTSKKAVPKSASAYDKNTFSQLEGITLDTLSEDNLGVGKNGQFYYGDKPKDIAFLEMNGSEVTIGLEGQTEEDDDGIKTQLTKTYDLRQKQDFMDFYNKTSLSRTSSIKQRTMALNALWNKMQPKNN
tara:strand:+ start:665 stop:2134 length:1470 start_codon:yes stop_codon:yes gene_type:complete